MSYPLSAAKPLITAATALLFVAASPAFAVNTPDSLNNATLVQADKAKELQGAGAKMIDTRVSAEYAEAHIKGAINAPYKEKSKKAPDYDPKEDSFDLTKLPTDKNSALIAYCNGAECWKSYKASSEMVKAGYKKVYWFREGFPAWKAKGYPVE